MAFRIHEDVDNALDLNKENKVTIDKSNGNDKERRTKFANLNNVGLDNRAHAQKTAFNILAGKKIINIQNNQINDENQVPDDINPDGIKNAERKIPVDQFKAFCVYEDTNQENEYVCNKDDMSFDKSECSTISMNVSIVSTERLPLQEIRTTEITETPPCIRELLSPMSVDKSNNDDSASKPIEDEQQLIAAAELQRNQIKYCFEVEEYRTDILDYLKESEKLNRPKPLYMRKQPDINHSMRTILIDWLVEVCEEYRLQSETLCLAISYIDRFLSVMSVVRAKLQLVGTAAMFIAAKYEEIYPPDVGEFVYITDNTYTKKQVLRMEQLILKVLTFDLCVPTFSIFLTAYAIADDIPDEIKHLAQYFCELSLLEAEPYLQYVPSMLSSAAIALARYNHNLPIWTESLERLTGYNIERLHDIILHMGNTHNLAKELQQQAIQEKYKNVKYSEASLREPVDIDKQALSRAIKLVNATVQIESGNECNDNVPNMISALLYV